MDVLTTIAPATVESSRQRLQQRLSDDNLAVAVVRGKRRDHAACAANAELNTQGQGWRVVVWVQDSEIFAPGQEMEIFGEREECCCAMWRLGKTRKLLVHVPSVDQLDDAFLKAEGV